MTSRKGCRYKRRSLLERFNEKWISEAKTSCWLWMGASNSRGYGSFWMNDKCVSAHRAAYILFGGVILKDLTIDHLCRNRMCVNPAHMEIVSGRENTLRGNGQSAIHARKTHCYRGHPLSGDNLYFNKHRNERVCKKCHSESAKLYYQRLKHRKDDVVAG
jgi:hypothetical protein